MNHNYPSTSYIEAKKPKLNVGYLLIDLLIYLVAFIVVYYFHTSNFLLNDVFFSYFFPYIICSAIASLLTRKFSFDIDEKKRLTFRPFFYSFILMLGLLSAVSFFIKPIETSRFVVVGSLVISLILELIWVRFGIITKPIVDRKSRIIYSRKLFLMDSIVLLMVLITTFYFKLVKYLNSDIFYLLLACIFVSWFISFRLTQKFELNLKANYISYIWPYIKSYILIISLNIFVYFLLRLESAPVKILLQGLFLYSLWSSIVMSYVYFNRRPTLTDEIRTKIFKATAFIDFPANGELRGKIEAQDIPDVSTSINEKIKNVYLKSLPYLYDLINNRIDLRRFDTNTSVVIRSYDIYNVEVLQDKSIDLFINLHQLNDIRRINAYFIELNKKLRTGSIFIGKFEPLSCRHSRYLKNYPYLIAQFLYFFDFLWRRVTPKLPLLQKFYFGITRGRNRAISLAECLGRLYYCGFEVIDLFEPDYNVFFIARKVKEPSTDTNPSYGLFFKMKRIGKDGKEIFVYKMRTMHPYSEYVQKFVYDINQLEDGGKIKNDFRISYWGKFLRKVWIDELPMIINFLKGELKIIGVRPLSKHYFGLYPEDLKKLRGQVKPGLVPPFYYDLPKTFEDIIKSEREYLRQYFNNPIKTDLKYFYKSFYNIVFKNARSA